MKKRKILAASLAATLIFASLPLLGQNGLDVEASEHGREYLTGLNLDIYDALRGAVTDIAAGKREETVITLDLTYTYSELGIETFQEVQDAVVSDVDLATVMSHVLYDCVYELYWMDKTAGVNYHIDIFEQTDSAMVEVTYTLPVAEEYQASSGTEVDEEKIESANAVIGNAQAIVDKYADLSDIEKLTAYKDEICELVSYEENTTDVSYEISSRSSGFLTETTARMWFVRATRRHFSIFVTCRSLILM